MKLAIFDLDYTIWHPEMYQLQSTPRLVDASSSQQSRLSTKVMQEAATTTPGMIIMSGGSPIRMFSGA